VLEHGDSDGELGTGGRQASSPPVERPSTAPEFRRESDTGGPGEEELWLERERQEWARLRASSDKHLADGEQQSQACSAAKQSGEERLAVGWHSLPTPYLFEMADVPYTFLAQMSGAETIDLVERNLKKKRVQLQRNQERRGGGGGTTPGESGEEAIKVINALLDWCRCELFPFLVEVDARMTGADPMTRAYFLYQTLIHPLREISLQKTATAQNPETRADA